MDAWQIYIDLNHCLDKLLEKGDFSKSHFNWNKAQTYGIISEMNTAGWLLDLLVHVFFEWELFNVRRDGSA